MANDEPNGRDQVSYDRETPVKSPEEILRLKQLTTERGQDRSAPRVLTDVPDKSESFMESRVETKGMSVEDALSRGLVRKVEEMIAKADYYLEPGESAAIEVSGRNVVISRSAARTDIAVDGVPVSDPRTQEFLLQNQREINERIRQAVIREERAKRLRNIHRAVSEREARRRDIRMQIEHNKQEYGKQMAQKRNESKEGQER